MIEEVFLINYKVSEKKNIEYESNIYVPIARYTFLYIKTIIQL